MERVKTIGQYKCLKEINELFFCDSIDIKFIEKNTIQVTDIEQQTLYFVWNEKEKCVMTRESLEKPKITKKRTR